LAGLKTLIDPSEPYNTVPEKANHPAAPLGAGPGVVQELSQLLPVSTGPEITANRGTYLKWGPVAHEKDRAPREHGH
jgi:hypothetical protein